MTAERVSFWKRKAEECWRNGDMKGFADAEANIEAWRLWDSLSADEQEEVLRNPYRNQADA